MRRWPNSGENGRPIPKTSTEGLAYANALESLGQTDKQLAVYEELVKRNPGNAQAGRPLWAQAGRQRAAAPKPFPVLERAAAGGKSDWRVYSALGSAYDEQGLYQKARRPI